MISSQCILNYCSLNHLTVSFYSEICYNAQYIQDSKIQHFDTFQKTGVFLSSLFDSLSVYRTTNKLELFISVYSEELNILYSMNKINSFKDICMSLFRCLFHL